MLQQQFGYYHGPLGNQITTIVNLFKGCGGKSVAYKEAVSQLPVEANPHLAAALRAYEASIQQQKQQLQM